MVAVLHRRAGKTYGLLWLLILTALRDETERPRYYYIAPTYSAAKAIAWDYLLSFLTDAGIPYEANVQELRVDFPNGARIALLGVENADRLRGRYADGVVLDEAAQMPVSMWLSVLRPMLADRKGFAIFTGTPQGRHNLLAEMHEYALIDDDWHQMLLTVDETDALDPNEVALMRKQLSREAYAQEMLCSFDSSLTGAFYAEQMAEMEQEGRITRVVYDNAHPVYCALDLGWSDALAIWYFQKVGNAIQCFKYEEHRGMSLPMLVKHWQEQSHPINQVILPHDANVHELGTGKSRLEVLQGLGVNCLIGRKMGVHDGIEAVRVTLPRVWIDRENCQLGIDALRSYRSEYDEVKRVHKISPLHDWASHGADAMRYLAIAQGQVGHKWGKLDYSDFDRAMNYG